RCVLSHPQLGMGAVRSCVRGARNVMHRSRRWEVPTVLAMNRQSKVRLEYRGPFLVPAVQLGRKHRREKAEVRELLACSSSIAVWSDTEEETFLSGAQQECRIHVSRGEEL